MKSKNSSVVPHASKLTFVGAEATNTRLMGVVGVVTHWLDEAMRKITQIFHLDYEVYGIDGFYHLTEPDEKERSELILGVTGGLGGKFVSISFRELVYLLKTAYHVEPNSVEAHVDFDAYLETFLSWEEDLTEAEVIGLMSALNPPIVSEIQAINYAIMRLVGCDPVSAIALWENPAQAVVQKFFDAPFTLIKNTSTLMEAEEQMSVYKVEALIDFEAQYKLLVFKVVVNPINKKIRSVALAEDLKISSIEASFNLNKPEHIIVTNVKDAFFERRFVENNPEMMKQTYFQGQLYIEFNTNNDHVALNPYFLNGDIYAMYFFSRSGHMLIASFSKANLEAIDETLLKNHAYEESLQFICELKTDDPIMYGYINSNYETIFDYLSH
jgi:hypothetical protein